MLLTFHSNDLAASSLACFRVSGLCTIVKAATRSLTKLPMGFVQRVRPSVFGPGLEDRVERLLLGIARVPCGLIPNPSNSVRVTDRPVPNSSRPLDRMSTVAAEATARLRSELRAQRSGHGTAAAG